jgi:hypothetical protein
MCCFIEWISSLRTNRLYFFLIAFHDFVKMSCNEYLLNLLFIKSVYPIQGGYHGTKITDNLLLDLRKFIIYRLLRDAYNKHDTDRNAKETEYGLNII